MDFEMQTIHFACLFLKYLFSSCRPSLYIYYFNLLSHFGALCCYSITHSVQMAAACVRLLFASAMWVTPLTRAAVAVAVPAGPSELLNMTRAVPVTPSDLRTQNQRRAVSSREIHALLDYHNRVCSQVFPPAANMEYMVSGRTLHHTVQFD